MLGWQDIGNAQITGVNQLNECTMFFEVTIKHVITDKKGNDKEVGAKYIVENQELFAQAELKAMELPLRNIDVTDIKRSKLREFANNPTGAENEAIYIATIVDIFTDDKDNVKKLQYPVGLYAISLTDANKVVTEYMAQGLADMECEDIKKSNFEAVI
jgi:hypothetical protein